MDTREIITLLNKMGKVTPKAYWEKNKVSLAGAPGLGDDIDGSFAYIYEAVKKGKIKLLMEGDQIVGINFDAGADTLIDDNRLGKIFNDRYAPLPIEYYVKTAMALVASNTSVDAIIEDYITGNAYIVISQDRVVIDVYGNNIANADEKLCYTEDVTNDLITKAQAYLEEVRLEYEDDEYDEYDADEYWDEEEDCEEDCDCDCCSCDCCSDEQLPETVVIPFRELNHDISIGNIKKYLRAQYGYYLSGQHADPNMRFDRDSQGVYVTNIHWGRKK